VPFARPLAALLALAVAGGIACGGGGDAAPQGAGDGSGRDTTSAPTLTAPASRFALALGDLPPGYLTDRDSTFTLDAEVYGATRIFAGAAEGKQLLQSWGYIGGYETAFQPEQFPTSLLNGAYYAWVEIHLFRDTAAATKAAEYFESRLQGSSDRISADRVGNSSSAWKLTRDKIPGSSIDAVYHRVVFRRGNMVAVVQTYGSDPLMTIKTATSLATIVDDKALGQRPAAEPTPLEQPGVATPTPGR